MLKFALPCTSDKTIPCLPSGVSEWCVPYILKKLVDVDRLDILLAPLGDARVCKQPENKSKELPKAKAKGKAKQKGKKRSLADDDDDETITASIYGEDLLNAVNYTIELTKLQNHFWKQIWSPSPSARLNKSESGQRRMLYLQELVPFAEIQAFHYPTSELHQFFLFW